jgi:hypothetical protein
MCGNVLSSTGPFTQMLGSLFLWIRKFRMFLGLPDPDPDPLVRGTAPDPDSAPDPAPDHSLSSEMC